jgi:hypothetical protein
LLRDVERGDDVNVRQKKAAAEPEPTTGLEPVTSSLPRKCSTTELGGQDLERETGFEPATFSLEG